MCMPITSLNHSLSQSDVIGKLIKYAKMSETRVKKWGSYKV